MSIPINRDELRKRWGAGERFGLHFFYGHKPPAHGVDDSCFSQWYIRPFSVDDVGYPTAEHWMMAEKARLFLDHETRKAILSATTPREAKALGRKVRNFNSAIWDKQKFEIVQRGNYEKFSQHLDLKSYLLSTAGESLPEDTANAMDGGRIREKTAHYHASKMSGQKTVILVEAAVNDAIWGIGLDQRDSRAFHPNTWQGENLLGFALTIVREQLRMQVNK